MSFYILIVMENAQVLPNGNYHFTFGASGASVGANFLISKIVKNIAQCRSSGITDAAFNILYGIEGALYYYTTPTPTVTVPDMDAWFNTWQGGNYTSNRLSMPSTCTYETFVSKGYCALRYTGLQSLTGLDITISGQVAKCPNSPIPSIYIGCKGTDCFLANKFKFCSSNADCTPTTVCNDLFNISVYSTPDNSTNNNNNTCTNCSSVESTNVIASIFAPAIGAAFFLENSTTCWNKDKDLFLMLKNGLRYMEGLAPDMDDNNVLFMCAPDPEFVKRVNASKWALDQVVVTGTTITMNDLVAWDTPVVILPPPPASTGSGSSTDDGLVRIVSVFMILFMLFCI